MLDLLLPHNGSTLELANIYLASSIVVGFSCMRSWERDLLCMFLFRIGNATKNCYKATNLSFCGSLSLSLFLFPSGAASEL